MAVTIRMSRFGSKKNPFYRVVATDKQSPRDGRFLEVLGTYDPRKGEGKGTLNKERIDYWISKGAKPSETVDQVIARTFK